MQNFQKQFAPVDAILRESGNFAVYGDYLADTFNSAKLVLLSAAISGSRNPLDIAAFTSLPVRFVDMVLRIMDRLELWENQNSVRLFRILAETPEDVAEIVESVDRVTEDLWMEAPSQDVNEYLGELRQGLLPGGSYGTYPLLDPDCDETHHSRLHSAYLGRGSRG